MTRVSTVNFILAHTIVSLTWLESSGMSKEIIAILAFERICNPQGEEILMGDTLQIGEPAVRPKRNIGGGEMRT